MKKLFIVLFLVLSVKAYAIEINHGPYICNMDSTSCTIMWTTDKPGMAWVEVADMADDHFYAQERQKYFQTLNGRKVVNDTVHQVRIEGLKPGTQYRYRIFTTEATDWTFSDYVTYGRTASSVVYEHDPYTFKTFPSEAKDLHFIVLNDIHERAAFMTDLCKNIDFSKVDFVILNGDMSSRIESQEGLLSGFVDSLVSICATSVPIFMLRGNHETRGKFADYFNRYFPTPSGKCYQLRNFFGVDFLFVDSGEDKPDSDIEYGDIADYDNYRIEQAKWIKHLRETKQFGKNKIVVFCHMPPTLEKWHGPIHLQETIVPELNKLNIAVMLSGHLHYYAYQEPNEIINFPNLANTNNAYLDCYIKGGTLQVETIGLEKNDYHKFTYQLK